MSVDFYQSIAKHCFIVIALTVRNPAISCYLLLLSDRIFSESKDTGEISASESDRN
jgi:hypothetical protein